MPPMWPPRQPPRPQPGPPGAPSGPTTASAGSIASRTPSSTGRRSSPARKSDDTGKPLKLAAALDIPRAVSNFRFFADAAGQFATEAHAVPGAAINYTLRQPLGVVACISPWNLPLYLLSWKVAPALATGNCVIAKPSEFTPLTAALLGELCSELGLPAGVLNIVQGSGAGAGQALIDHPAIRAISFTGGTATGRAIATAAARDFKRVTLELGGKNATLVFADADLEAAVNGCVRAAFTNQGEICLCGSRVLIEASDLRSLPRRAGDPSEGLRIGDPLDPATDQGAIVSEAQMKKVLAAIADARGLGGRILCGGARVAMAEQRCAGGWFVAPTLIDGLAADCSVNQEEIFGPVATLVPFNGESEALRIANSTRYGLAASVWSRDVARWPPPGRAARGGRRLDQHLADARPAHADRRRQAFGRRPRRRARGAPVFHRTEECVRCSMLEKKELTT